MATYEHARQQIKYPTNFSTSHLNKEGSDEVNPTLITSSKQTLNRSEIARKAAKTRLMNDPDAFKKMGSKGGKARHEREKESEEV